MITDSLICNGAWIGEGCIVAGAVVGAGCVIAAGHTTPPHARITLCTLRSSGTGGEGGDGASARHSIDNDSDDGDDGTALQRPSDAILQARRCHVLSFLRLLVSNCAAIKPEDGSGLGDNTVQGVSSVLVAPVES